MRNAHLDQSFVDASILRELLAFREELKRQYILGYLDMRGALHRRHLATKGNLGEMSKPDCEGRFTYLAWYVASVFALSLAACRRLSVMAG